MAGSNFGVQTLKFASINLLKLDSRMENFEINFNLLQLSSVKYVLLPRRALGVNAVADAVPDISPAPDCFRCSRTFSHGIFLMGIF